jgi:hypothetical protein
MDAQDAESAGVETAVVEETVLVTDTGAESLSGVEWQTW